MRRSPLALLIVAGPVIVFLAGYLWVRGAPGLPGTDDAGSPAIPATGPITLALAGDVLMTSPLGALERDAGFIAVRDLVRGADFATANIEMNLLGREDALGARLGLTPRWPFGSEREAQTLKGLGFDAIALANDHAADYGPDAIAATMRILDRAGLLHAGAGVDLARARAPALAGDARKIAFISVAATSQPDARATLARTDIVGRAGVSPLRYAADITVDAATFQTLKDSLAALNAGTQTGERELMMFGTPIKKGERTSVEFIVDQTDERAVLEEIETARLVAEVVVVSVHSHEPANASEQPADFIRRFARAAIDHGASLVFGHGPHRLRGIETYGDGAILYSLGNFLYQTADLDFRAANLYDVGADLHEAAVGALGSDRPPPGRNPPDEPTWWEGLLALATFEGERLTRLQLVPIDLGADESQREKGIPRIAPEPRAEAILERVSRLSSTSGTSVQVEGKTGFVRGISSSELAR